CQGVQHCNNNGLSVDVEEATSSWAGIRETEAICTENGVVAWDPFTDLVWQISGEVRHCNVWAGGLLQLGGYECLASICTWVAQLCLVTSSAIASQVNPRSSGVNVGTNSVVSLK